MSRQENRNPGTLNSEHGHFHVGVFHLLWLSGTLCCNRNVFFHFFVVVVFLVFFLVRIFLCLCCGKQSTSVWWLGNQPYKETKERLTRIKNKRHSAPSTTTHISFDSSHLLGSMFSKCFAIEIGGPRTTLCGTPDALTLYKHSCTSHPPLPLTRGFMLIWSGTTQL